jgi:hypothetical protein
VRGAARTAAVAAPTAAISIQEGARETRPASANGVSTTPEAIYAFRSRYGRSNGLPIPDSGEGAVPPGITRRDPLLVPF